MPVETAAYISDLNASYPEGSDGADQGDNHIRLLKAVLKAQFPNFTAAALQATQEELEDAIASVAGLSALKLLAGTVDAPGASFADDPDTGVYLAADGQIGVAIAGALVALLSAEGLVLSGNLAATGGIASTAGFLGPGVVPVGAVLEWYADALPNTAYGIYTWANGGTADASIFTELAALWPSRVSGGLITLPDRRDNVGIGKANMGGATDADRISTFDTTSIFGQVGEGTHTLSIFELPYHNHGGSTGNGGIDHTHTVYDQYQAAGAGAYQSGSGGASVTSGTTRTTSGASAYIHNHEVFGQGGDAPFNLIQPGIVCNYIIRIA